jgi:hypothetical protein
MIVTRVYKKILPADATNAVQLIAGASLPAGKSAQLRSLHICSTNDAAETVTIGVAGDERKVAIVAATSQQQLPHNPDGWAQFTGAGGDLYAKLSVALTANKELHLYATVVIS